MAKLVKRSPDVGEGTKVKLHDLDKGSNPFQNTTLGVKVEKSLLRTVSEVVELVYTGVIPLVLNRLAGSNPAFATKNVVY